MRATAREALEHIHGAYAFEELAVERARAKRKDAPEDEFTRAFGRQDEHAPVLGGVDPTDTIDRRRCRTVTGPEARAVADRPHLTEGTDHYWPEWDELELAETDPNKPPLKIQW